MIKVMPRRNESIQQTLRRFRKILEKEGIIKEIKRNMYFESPSEIRSRIRRRRVREREKEVRENQQEKRGGSKQKN